MWNILAYNTDVFSDCTAKVTKFMIKTYDKTPEIVKCVFTNKLLHVFNIWIAFHV